MKLTKAKIKIIEVEARKYFVKATGGHDWSHVERVRQVALRIGRIEKADLLIVEAAALLHDIARNEEIRRKGNFCHALEGAKLARKILGKLDIDEEIVEQVAHAIEAHRKRNDCQPATLEAKVLQDADRIDSIGAVGIGRNFLFAGNAGSNNLYTGNEQKIIKAGLAEDYVYTKEDSAILEYEAKLKYIYAKILTKSGKQIAKARSDFQDKFFKQFWLEVKGRK